jgi:hypothetical protein
MSFVLVEDPEINIWEKNPELALIIEFAEFREKEGEIRSSDILKAVYYIHDPKSKLRDTSVSQIDLIHTVNTTVLEDPKFNWDDYDYIVDVYLKYNTSKIESLLLRYEDEIEQLNKILESWKWDKSNIKDRADALKQYQTLLTELSDLRERVLAETNEHMEMHGGYQTSLIEDLGNAK